MQQPQQHNNNNVRRGQGRQQAGLPPRNAVRMNEYQAQRNDNGQRDWNVEVEREERFVAAAQQRRRRNNNPPPQARIARRVQQQRPVDVNVNRATNETAPKDDDLYDSGMFGGTHPINCLRSHNLDFASFGILIDASYQDMMAVDNRVSRTMPFAAYQHYCTTLLHTRLLNMSADDNHLDLLPGSGDYKHLIPDDLVIPQCISHYLAGIGPTVTPHGMRVHVNLPEATIPRIAAEELASGHFGPVVADNHNAYEVHFSPFVTRAYVQRELEVNMHGHQDIAANWNPFPAGSFPANCTPNENLLGWHMPRRLHPEGTATLNRLNNYFDEGDDLRGRLQFNGELMAMCSGVINGLNIKKAAGLPKTQNNDSIVGFLRLDRQLPSSSRLASHGATICSPVTMSANNTQRVSMLGLKRKRTDTARGMCFTHGNNAPPNWNATINNSFNMVGDFAPNRIGVDIPMLREADFVEQVPDQSVTLTVTDWIQKKFRA